ncbi:MAG: amidohydrolase family protein [Planctomycetota bacterium]
MSDSVMGLFNKVFLVVAICCVGFQSHRMVAAEPDNELGQWKSAARSVETTVYLVDRLYSGNAEPAIENAALVVSGGRVLEVTPQAEFTLQPGWKVESLAGSTVIPGMVIAETGLVSGGDEERTLSPEIRAVDGFDFFAEYDSLLASGITTVQVSPGRNRLIPGQTAVVKLAGEDQFARAISDVESLRIQLTQAAFSAPTIYEPPVAAVSVERPLVATRFQVASDLPSALLTVRALWKTAKQDKPLEDPDDELIVEAISPFVGQTVRVTARSTNEVLAVVNLMDELEQPFILVAPSRVEPVIDRLVDSTQLRGVVLEHDLRPGVLTTISDPESETPLPLTLAERWLLLRKRLSPEIPIAVKPESDGDLRDMRFLISTLMSRGTSDFEALASVTADAARLLGVGDSVGTLFAGKHADFVVLSGPPLEPETRVLKTFVDGELVYNSEPKSTSILLSGATVCLPGGEESIADIAVSKRSIRAIGPSVSASPDGMKYPLEGCYITPAFLDAGTRLGAGRAITSRISLGDKLGKYLVPNDDSVRRGRMGGIGIGLLSSDSLPSPVVAFKLSDNPRVLKDPVALRSRLSGNPTTGEASLDKTLKGAKAYADSWVAYDKKQAEYKIALAKYEAEKKKYDEALAKKKKEEEAKKKAEAEKAKASGSSSKPTGSQKPEEKKEATPEKPESKPPATKTGESSKDEKSSDKDEKKESDKASEPKPPQKPTAPKPPRSVSTLEPYRAVFKKQIPLIIEVSEESGVETALKVVVEKYDLKLVLATSGTAFLAADKIGEKSVPVIVGPTLNTIDNGRSYNLPQYFRTAGCPVILQTRATTAGASLPQVIAHAASRGLGRGDAVEALTSDAAEVFQLEKVGELKPGFDADLTVFDGPPFYPSSRVVGVMIDGEWAYLDSEFDPYTTSKAGN